MTSRRRFLANLSLLLLLLPPRPQLRRRLRIRRRRKRRRRSSRNHQESAKVAAAAAKAAAIPPGTRTMYCFGFQNGKCPKSSADCMYAHEKDPNPLTPRQVEAAKAKALAGRAQVSTKKRAKMPPRRAETEEAGSVTMVDKPRRFFAEGKCKKGDECTWFHAAVPAHAAEVVAFAAAVMPMVKPSISKDKLPEMTPKKSSLHLLNSSRRAGLRLGFGSAQTSLQQALVITIGLTAQYNAPQLQSDGHPRGLITDVRQAPRVARMTAKNASEVMG